MSLDEFRGYGTIIKRIQKAIINGNISHAYIIEGDSCIDKTAFAKNIIKAVMCREKPGSGCDCCPVCMKIDHDNYEDLYYARADEKSMNLKDREVSALQEKLKTKPSGGDRNFAIIENADSMTPRAQNRLLKTLEEPAPGTVIFLLSENTDNLLKTITSRCVAFRLGNFTDNTENLDLGMAEKLLEMIVEDAYFSDINKYLTKKVKDRKTAFVLLDSLERLFHRDMTENRNSSFGKDNIVSNVNYVEEARRDLLANVNYKYAIRNMILKIGGINK